MPVKDHNYLKREETDNKKFLVFATDIKFNLVKEFTKKIPNRMKSNGT